jgi:formiminoglutamase
MKHLKLFTEKEQRTLLSKRKGETKFGEQIKLISNLTNIYDDISSLDVQYVIFGIEEDIGVQANYGKSGSYRNWGAVKKSLINLQSNCFTNPDTVLILGELNFKAFQDEAKTLNSKNKKDLIRLRQLVEEIDKEVAFLVAQIVKAGKIPIAIGGGHNNAYGLIKGTALTKNTKINAVNFDAHTDFRAEEGRHSGNGFSYAFAEGFLKNYYVIGLHENYISAPTNDTIKKLKSVKYTSFESLEIRKEKKLKEVMKTALDFVNSDCFGLEIDCDAIENIASSAASPTGFSVKQARQFVNFFGYNEQVCYLHICEAIPSKKKPEQTGKLISYLITDFIRSHESGNSSL